MNFVVDAQLPRRMIGWLTAAACDAVHTLDLSQLNRTTNEQINEEADREQREFQTHTFLELCRTGIIIRG